MRVLAFAVSLLLFITAVKAADAPVLPSYPEVRPSVAFQFPADHGAHPDFRNEWWYVTGWLETGDGRQMGFQVTFFRIRPANDQNNPSAFAAKQVLFAHAALSDPAVGHLLHDQRVAREGFGLAEASTTDMDVVLDDWNIKRDGGDRIHTRAGGKEFVLDLNFTPTQPIMLQGDNGYSRKGPLPTEASHYYSLPHLTVSGSVERDGKTLPVKGTAWLDREWSSSYLDPNAVGWDWVGFNLDDGAAVMAFQIRDSAGHALWAGGSFRNAKGDITRFAPDDVSFVTLRSWHSPRTGADYPVERTLVVRLPEGARQWRIMPLFDDQELDSRAGGGPVYWEGAARIPGGRGYLELTGYFKPLKM
ncbi:MAG TPA: carotenoid 1,2-hydratase [Micropepsaceae bacterium]|nr:carotenoid 1,2-hydratase [Micropepsaceae bacterium]